VLNDSGQLRAQRDMAVTKNGDHEIIISSDRDLQAGRPQVDPSEPLGRSGSRIYYYDGPPGRITHQWVNNRWVKIR
jgi:hypothetical protein